MARKAVAQELTRQMIMDAARELFVEKGYQQVSMRQIARRLNYSHGAIYYHFQNKAALFFSLVEDDFDLLDEKMDILAKKDLDNEQKLRNMMLGYIEFGLVNQSHYEIMFLIKDDEVRNFLKRGPLETYKKFADRIAALSEKHLSVQEIWSIFLSLHGFVTHYLQHITTYTEAKGMAECHVDMLMQWTKKK